jgi:peptide/nickel transport system substrate-binding protein
MIMVITAGCTEKPGGDGKKIVTAIISVENRLALMDPTFSGSHDLLHYEMIYEPLVRYGKDGALEPCLATSWEISGDGREYIFHLRQDVKFSDGTVFNADAVVFTVKRWEGKAGTASLAIASGLEDVRKIDDYTVKMTFSKSYYPYLTELTYPRPCRILGVNSVSPSGTVGGEFVKPVGTGPWMVESSVDGQETVLVPNPYYYGEKPKVDKIILKVISDPQARVMAMQSGEADISTAELPLENLPAIKADKHLVVLECESTKSYHLMFNYDNPFLQDRNLRQAINYAINKKSLAGNLLNGAGKPAKGVLPPTVPYVTDGNSQGYGYDPGKAKELLAKSGYTDQDGDGILEKAGRPLRLNLVFQNTEYAEWKQVCEFLQSELKQAGIDVTLRLLEVNAYYDAIWTTRDFDMVIYRSYEDSWNPHGYLTSLYKGGKPVAWYNETLNRYIDEVLETTGEPLRRQKYDQLFKLMNDEAMTAPLYYPAILYVYNNRLVNVELAGTAAEVVKWNTLDIAR